MERNGDSREQSVCKRVFFPLIMLLMGLIFCYILVKLCNFTYKTLTGDISYCSLWTDIPGRMAIFLLCLYVACLCGYFPMPTYYRPRWFPEPFILWKYESWRNLFRSLFIPTPSAELIRRLRMNAQDRRDSDTLPLYRERHQRFYTVAQRGAIKRRRTAPVYINPEDNVGSEADRYRSTSEDLESDEVFQSLDSPKHVDVGFIRLVKAEISRPRFQSDTTENLAVSSQMKEQGAPRQEQGAPRQEQGASRKEQKKNIVEYRRPNFPRYPWGYHRHPGGIPPVAAALHRRNLEREKQEERAYEKKLKAERKKALKKVETKENVTHDASDTIEKQSAPPKHAEESEQSEDLKERESEEYPGGKFNVGATSDQPTTENIAEDDRQEATHKEIDSKKPEKVAGPYLITGTRQRLRTPQENPPQRFVPLHRLKKGIKYMDDLEASRLDIPMSRSGHRRTQSVVDSPGMSERSSIKVKQEKDTHFEEILIAQAQYESTQMWLRMRHHTHPSFAAPSNSESAPNTDLGTQRQLADLPATATQKTEQLDAGDLPISSSKQSDEN